LDPNQIESQSSSELRCIDINNKTESYFSKVEFAGTDISCGNNHVCILTKNGTVECLGSNGAYKEAVLSDEMKYDVLKVKAGRFFTCVVKKDLRVICNGKKIRKC